MRRAWLLAWLVALAAPGAAGAAYAPRLEVTVDPPTPDTASALTATLRQAPGESASRTQVVRFPPVFRFNPGFSVRGCTAQQEADRACPEASRIGVASAETELGPASGPVHLTQDFRVLIFMRGVGGLVEEKIQGVFRLGPDGWVESVLDGLPPVRATFARVRLDAGPRSLVLTPEECGSHPVEGRFTSHENEVASSRTTVTIAGCRTPSISALAARARGGRIDVSWTLAAATTRADLVLERRVRTRPWVRWARVRATAFAAGAGEARRRLSGPRGRRLAPGRYRVSLVTHGSGDPADTRRIEVSLRR